MRRRENSIIVFIILCLFLVITFLLRDSGFANGIRSIGEQIISPFQSAATSVLNIPSNLFTNKQIEDLKKENRNLLVQKAEFDRTKEDNKALRDQFVLTSPAAEKLIPAKIIGMPNFIPGISKPDEIILNVGQNDGAKEGDAVVFENNFLGKIKKTSDHRSVVMLVSSKNSSITVKDSDTGALGVLTGLGGGDMVLENVVLSDSLNIPDAVTTKDDPSDLIVGKIVSVNKKASDLFQSANIKSLTDVTKLPVIFVLTP